MSTVTPLLPDTIFGIVLNKLTPTDWCRLRLVSRSLNASCYRSLTYSPELVTKMLRGRPNAVMLTAIFQRCTNLQEIRLDRTFRLDFNEIISLPYPETLQRLDLEELDIRPGDVTAILHQHPTIRVIAVSEHAFFHRKKFEHMPESDKARLTMRFCDIGARCGSYFS